METANEERLLDWLIDTVRLLGLLLLFGAAGFRFLLWPSGVDHEGRALRQSTATRMAYVMAAGLVLATAAGIPSLKDPLFGIEQLLLALFFFTGFYFGARTNKKMLIMLALLAGLGVVSMQSLTSHAAHESGVVPIVSSILHWLIAISWGGTVLHLALQPWPDMIAADDQHNARVARVTKRYATKSLVALALLALTGGLLGFVHVHNADALSTTSYGMAYALKALLFVALLVTVSLQRIRIVPACRETASTEELQRGLRQFRGTVGFEAVLLTALIVTTGNLATGNAPGVAPFLNPQTWQVRAGDVPLDVRLQPVAGRISRARLEIAAADPDYRFPDGTIATFSMATTPGDAGHGDTEALPIGPAAFLGETVLAVPGEWRFNLTLRVPEREPVSTTHVVTLPGPPLKNDLGNYLKLTTIAYSRASLITFGVGALLLIVALWTVRICTRGVAPFWLMPTAFVSGTLGGFLILSVMFVKTYPSSFWPNPQPFTLEVVQRGETLYREHCAECHGIAGAGDGPWAVAERGSIPDLAAPHMDTHTDGELFWWNKYGIPSLDMPAFGDELTDDENWTVINFVRSLRHAVPPTDRSPAAVRGIDLAKTPEVAQVD